MAVSAGVKAAIAIAGAAMQAYGAIQQGNAAKASADFQSEQLRQQAERDRQIANQQSQDFARNEERRRATLRANVAGSGVTLEGTPLAVLGDMAQEAEFQQLRIRAGGETQATRAENQATISRFEGRQAQRVGFTRAGASLLTGVSSFGKKK